MRHFAILHLDHMKFLALYLVESADYRQTEFVNSLVGRRTFLLKIAFEILHVLRLHAKDSQRFKKFNMLGRFHASIQLAGSLQATFISLQSNTASEQLNCLRSFALGKIDQSYGGYAPAVPAFGKLTGSDQHFDFGILCVDTTEQGIGNEFLCADNDALLLAIFQQSRGVTDVDDAKVISVLANL